MPALSHFKLEQFKFLVYVGVPVLTAYVFNRPEVLQAIIKSRRYVVYKVPEEEPEVTETEVIEPLDASELRSVDAILARAQSRMKAGIATPPSKDS